jgi:hypothetical protein
MMGHSHINKYNLLHNHNNGHQSKHVQGMVPSPAQKQLPKMRPQEPFYKRVNEIEKKAKALEQDREEQ